MRARWAASIAIAAVLALAPATAATESYHETYKATGAWATLTNVDWSQDPATQDTGPQVPGRYYELYVDGLTSGEAYLSYYTYTIDENGEWTEAAYWDGTTTDAVVEVGNRLSSASLTATIAATFCRVYDDEGDCLELNEATFAVTAEWTAQGRPTHWHGTDSYGVSGQYQITMHGTGVDQPAMATVTVTMNGLPVDLDGAFGDALIFRTNQGYTEVTHP